MSEAAIVAKADLVETRSEKQLRSCSSGWTVRISTRNSRMGTRILRIRNEMNRDMKSRFSAVQIYRILCFFRFTVGSAFSQQLCRSIRYSLRTRQTVVSYSRNLLQLFHRVHLIEMKVEEKKKAK